jgi:hypothetical protein
MDGDSSERGIISRYHRTIAGVLIAIILADVGVMIYRKYDSAKYTIEREKMDFVFRFDPNFASVEELEVVPGLNRKLAGAIVEYREEYRKHYPERTVFLRADDLGRVKGISEKTITKAEEYLIFPDEEKQE